MFINPLEAKKKVVEDVYLRQNVFGSQQATNPD